MSFTSVKRFIRELPKTLSERRNRSKVILAGVAVVLLIIGATIAPPLVRLGKELFFGPVNVFTVTIPREVALPNHNGRTNFLLLGVGGGKHDGPNLTDTIIVASIKTRLGKDEDASKNPIILISIPRDLYMESIPGKINSAYAFGLEKDGQKGGFEAAKSVVTEATNLPIHYSVKVDFSAFEKIIDLLGGIDISVERSFDDFEYPITGKENDTCDFSEEDIKNKIATASALHPAELEFPCRFEHLHFDAGPTHMNGETALKFVRSRHAIGEESNDLARAKRQQLVISAVKAKVFSSSTLLNLGRLEEMYDTVKANVATDIPEDMYNALFSLMLRYRSAKLESLVIGFDLLMIPPLDYRGSVLVPKSGSFSEIYSVIEMKLQSPVATQSGQKN